MSKHEQEELRRLEEALLEDMWTEEPDQTQRFVSVPDYSVSNTDRTDVDLDAYSEDVYRGRSRGGLGILVTMLSMVALSACILLLFKIMGVL